MICFAKIEDDAFVSVAYWNTMICFAKIEDDAFVSVAYWNSLDRLCASTRKGSLHFYALTNTDNESSDDHEEDDLFGVHADRPDGAPPQPDAGFYALCEFDVLKTGYCVVVPPCWSEFQQSLRQRRQPNVQKLTDKNVRLQSEFTSRETKIQQLSSEYTSLKRQIKEAESKICMLSSKMSDEGQRFKQENDDLSNKLVEVTKAYDQCKQQVTDMKGEETLMKRKYEMSLKEMNKELHYCRRKLDDYEKPRSKSSNNSSSSSLNTTDSAGLVKTDVQIDKETLIEHIVNIQKVSAKKSDKIDFLEEHVNTLVADIQKKTKLLQSYILREQSGALTSNKMDRNKADFSKFNGLMASLYTSHVTDESVTLELSLDVNRKLQAVLEDTLLKNITLKENVDTLASEIDRMNKMLKQ
ncbi:unnamed protein product [Phaedon cochleariae]|uniref:Uncharacterized protein n=1 Tax=Phaedon cochleariae TaxID=80249 RepID=A0A9N9X0K0_PHACE|nr:unnamed protein product [Phaedon cochleariae]